MSQITLLDTPPCGRHSFKCQFQPRKQKDMPRLSTRTQPTPHSGGERVFTDDEGRRWSAALASRDDPSGALVFRSICESRRFRRVFTVNPLALREAVDDSLRGWLGDAQRIGILS
jgi:hypothetical protein